MRMLGRDPQLALVGARSGGALDERLAVVVMGIMGVISVLGWPRARQ